MTAAHLNAKGREAKGALEGRQFARRERKLGVQKHHGPRFFVGAPGKGFVAVGPREGGPGRHELRAVLGADRHEGRPRAGGGGGLGSGVVGDHGGAD